MTKKREHHFLTQIDVCGLSVMCFYTAVHLVVQVSQHITHTYVNIIILQSQPCQYRNIEPKQRLYLSLQMLGFHFIKNILNWDI